MSTFEERMKEIEARLLENLGGGEDLKQIEEKFMKQITEGTSKRKKKEEQKKVPLHTFSKPKEPGFFESQFKGGISNLSLGLKPNLDALKLAGGRAKNLAFDFGANLHKNYSELGKDTDAAIVRSIEAKEKAKKGEDVKGVGFTDLLSGPLGVAERVASDKGILGDIYSGIGIGVQVPIITPVSSLFQTLIEGYNEGRIRQGKGQIEGGAFKTIGDFFETAEEKTSNLIEGYAKIKDLNIKKEDIDLLSVGVVEGATEAAFGGAGAILKQTGKGVVEGTKLLGKGVAKTGEFIIDKTGNIARKIIGRKNTENALGRIDNLIEKFENEQVGTIVGDTRKGDLKTDLFELEKKIADGSVIKEDINTLIKKYKLPTKTGDEYRKLIDDINTPNSKVNFSQGNKFSKIDSFINTRQYRQILNDLRGAGYKRSLPDSERKSIIKEINKNYSPKDVNEVLKRVEEREPHKIFERTIGKDIVEDTPQRHVGNSIIDGIEDGLFIDDGKVIRLTPKGLKDVVKSAVNMSVEQLKEMNKKGIVQYPREQLDIIKAERAGNMISELEAKALFGEITGSKEIKDLRRLQIEKATSPDEFGTIDNDMIATLEKVNNNFGLGLSDDISKLYDSVTGIVDSKKLNDMVDKIANIRRDEFLTFNKVIFKRTAKTLEGQLGIDEKIYNNVYKAGQKQAQQNAKKRIKRLEARYEAKIKDLNKKLKGKSSELTIAKKLATIELNNKILEVNRFSDNIKGVKLEVIRNARRMFSLGFYKGDIDRVISKHVSKTLWDKADTGDKIKTLVDNFNREIIKEHKRALIKEIKDSLKEVKGVSPGSSKQARFSYTIDTRNQLIKLKEIIKTSNAGVLSITELEDLLIDIKNAKKVSSRNIKLKQNKTAIESSKLIDDIKNEGIKVLKGKEELIGDETIFKWGQKQWEGLMNRVMFQSRILEDIFGKGSKGYDLFHYAAKAARDKIELFFRDETIPVLKALGDLGMEKAELLTTYMFALQRNSTYIDMFDGLERMRHSPTYRRLFEIENNGVTYSDVKHAVPSEEYFELIKGTKLAGIIKQASTPEMQRARKLVNLYFSKEHSIINAASKEIDNVEIPKLPDYMPYVKKGGRNIEADTELGADFNMDESIYDGFTKSRSLSAVIGKEVIYNTNIIDIIARSSKKRIHYAYMKPTYDKMTQVFNGPSFPMKGRSNDEILDFLNRGFKVTDSKGNQLNGVHYDKEAKVFLDGEGARVDTDNLRFKQKEGIGAELGVEGNKLVNDYLDLNARGGVAPKDGTDKVAQEVMRIANVSKLVFNPSPALKQYLGLIDLMSEVGLKNVGKEFYEVLTNPKVSAELDKLAAVKLRLGGDPVLMDMLNTIGTGKIKRSYDWYTTKGTALLRMADAQVYKTAVLAAYKKALKERGLKFDGTFRNKKVLLEAETVADDVLSTADYASAPNIYKNLYAKSVFGLKTTQMNRVQRFLKKHKELGANKEYMAQLNNMQYFLISNLAEQAITHGVRNFLIILGLKKAYENNMSDFSKSMELLWNLTVGQTFTGGMVSSTEAGFDLSTSIQFVNNMTDDIGSILKGLKGAELDEAIKGISGMSTEFFGFPAKAVEFRIKEWLKGNK